MPLSDGSLLGDVRRVSFSSFGTRILLPCDTTHHEGENKRFPQPDSIASIISNLTKSEHTRKWSSDESKRAATKKADIHQPTVEASMSQVEVLVEEPSSPPQGNSIMASTVTSSPKKQASKATELIAKILDQYGSYVSNSWNQDKLLKILHYSLWMLSRFYVKSPQSQQGLSFLSGEILWARYVTRLLGWPTALQGILPTSTNDNGEVDKFRRLGKAMAWSMVFYYPLEALAYMKWKTPQMVAVPSYLGSDHRLAERASAWSCRAWVAYIVLDMVRSVQVLSTSPAKQGGGQEDDCTETEEDPSSLSTVTPQQRTAERLQILRNALYLAPAVHWSLPNWDTQPWLSDTTCKTLLWFEAVACMVQSILNLPPPTP